MSDSRQTGGLEAVELPIDVDLSDDRILVRVAGEIDASNADALAEELLAALSKGLPATVDLSGVTFIDSTGLHALIRVAGSNCGVRPITLANASRNVERVLSIVGIDEVPGLEITSSTDG